MFYVLAALGVGVAWYIVLLPFGSGLPMGGEHWFANLLAMCFTSLTLALVFRPLITRARGVTYHVLAIGLPSVGALVFGIYTILGWAIWPMVPGATVAWNKAIKTLPVFVLYGAWTLFFITVPMGYASQWLMQRASRRNSA